MAIFLIDPLRHDLKRGLVILCAGGLSGWILGYPVAGIAFACGGLLAYQTYAIFRMQRWIHDRRAAPPLGQGMLGDIEDRLQRTQRQARKRKKRLGKVVARFQQASEANPDGAIIIDASGCIEWLNKAAARLLALRQGQDHGQPIANLIRNPGFSTWLEEGEESVPFEWDSPAAGSPRLLLRAVPYGNSKRMLTVRDITVLHRLEQVRRDFVANVSHELRSPLTVVVGYLEGMSDDEELPERFRRPLVQMTQQSARMTRIVEDLLRLSRIENDPHGAALAPIEMAELVDALQRDAQLLSAAGHVIEQNVDRTAQLLGDYNEIYSALSNLVFNAVQYTPAGGIITLNWIADDDGARFEVRDTGEGIADHHIPRLTERFYRVDKARSREVGGTGLGLAIVKHVLKRHDAILCIGSEIGKGSVFSCEFPPRRVQREPAASAALDAAPAGAGDAQANDPLTSAAPAGPANGRDLPGNTSH